MPDARLEPRAQTPGAEDVRRHLARAFRFSVSEEELRLQQQRLVSHFAGCHSVLDIGCGRGVMLDLFREHGLDAEGIDIMPEAIAYCREKGHRVQIAEAIEYLADKVERYDGILCSHVLEHLDVEDGGRLVAFCFRALRLQGTLVLVTPNALALDVMGEVFWLDTTHRRPYPPKLVEAMLEDVGFTAIRTMLPLGHPARRREWPAWLLRKLLLGRYFGNPEAIVTAKKTVTVA